MRNKLINDWMLIVASILIHSIYILFFEKNYVARHWKVVAILCSTNLLTGLIIYLV